MHFSLPAKNKTPPVEMIGTYSTIPELRWAVIAQRSLDEARIDAGVQELTSAGADASSSASRSSRCIFGYLFAVGITRPIRGLVFSTRAISRAEFHERVEVRGAAEISELAETFNHMAGDIERIRRTPEAGRRRKSRAVPRLHPHARRRHRRKGSLHARPFRPRREIFHDHRRISAASRRGSRPPAHLRAAARRGQNRRGRPRPEKARQAHRRRIRPDEAASVERRQHHASRRAAERHAARHRTCTTNAWTAPAIPTASRAIRFR